MTYIVELSILIAIWTMLAVSFNLVIGFAGLLVVAHPLFYAFGAYGAGLLMIHTGMPAVAAIAIACAGAGLLSLAISIPCIRVSGDYLLIASIGFLMGSLQVIRNVDFLGGAGGLSGIPSLFSGPDRSLWALAVTGGCAAASLLFVKWFVGGDFGRAVVAMRDDEGALAGLGRNPLAIKVLLLAVGAMIAAIAGGLYGMHFQFVSPDQFEMLAASAMLAMVIVGGTGSILGPLVGATIMTALPQAVTFLDFDARWLGPVQGMIFTGIVILFLLFRPQGLVAAGRPKPSPAPVAK